MSSKVIYELFLWFHAEVKARKFPNTKTLAERFEITRKTAQRDVDFIRDRLRVPLQYVNKRRGYAYDNAAWELPAYWLGEEELKSQPATSNPCTCSSTWEPGISSLTAP